MIRVFKYSLFLILAGSMVSCATAPTPKERKLVVSPLWIRSTVKKEFIGPHGSHFMAPVFDADKVYQGNGVDGLVAYDRKSGAERWRVNLKNGVAGGGQIVNSKLYFGSSDGQFYCVSSISGATLWSFPTRAENLAKPLVADGVVYFLSGNNTLYALDADTGKQIWLYNRPQPTGLSVRGGSTPVLHNQTLFVGFSDGNIVALKAKEGSLLWERQISSSSRFRDVDGTPLIDDDYVIVSSFDSGLFGLLKSDGQIQWNVDAGGIGELAQNKSSIFYSTADGKVVALDSKTGKQKWAYVVTHGIATAPALFRDYLIFGESRGSVRILNVMTGALLASFNTGQGSSARPTVDEKTGEVFVLSNVANLFKLDITWKKSENEIY